MKSVKSNWPTWVGFLLSVFAVLSYPFVFVRWPVTRDLPWANFILFGVAAAFLFVGFGRSFAPERRLRSKIVSSVVTTLSVLIIGLFLFSFFIASRWLPASHGAPQVSRKAPDFSLVDTSGKAVTLADLLTAPIAGQAASSSPKGVLLIFYRGYW